MRPAGPGTVRTDNQKGHCSLLTPCPVPGWLVNPGPATWRMDTRHGGATVRAAWAWMWVSGSVGAVHAGLSAGLPGPSTASSRQDEGGRGGEPQASRLQAELGTPPSLRGLREPPGGPSAPRCCALPGPGHLGLGRIWTSWGKGDQRQLLGKRFSCHEFP